MANEEILKDEEMVEFETFTFEIDGKTIEWAITDEFEFEGKDYIVCQEVLGDELSDEGLYLFECEKEENDEITVKNIESEEEYDRIVDAYCEMEG